MDARIEALATPSVLAWARQMSGLSPEEAASKVHVSSERLKLWEDGEQHPSITQLRALAEAYKRPLALFYMATPPPDEAPPNDFRRFADTKASVLSPELRLAVRTARARRQALLELLEDLGEAPPPFTLRLHLGDDPERAGLQLRAALGILEAEHADARDWFNTWRVAAEAAGLLVFQAQKVLLTEMRGVSISDRPLPAVILNIKDAYSARSFSLLHDATHIALGAGGVCLLEEEQPGSEAVRTEVFCNHVAGAALVPGAALLQSSETPAVRIDDVPEGAIAALSRRFGASPEVILRRLLILGRITQRCYRAKREEFQRHYEALNQRPRRGFAPPGQLAVALAGKVFVRSVLEAYDERLITASDVADHLGVRLKHLEKIRSFIQGGALEAAWAARMRVDS